MLWALSAHSMPRKAVDLGILLCIFSTTFVQIFSKNVKIEENLKADDNRWPTTRFSGKVLKYQPAIFAGDKYVQTNPCNLYSVFIELTLQVQHVVKSTFTVSESAAFLSTLWA